MDTLRRMDVDGDGTISLRELVNLGAEINKQQKQNQRLTRLLMVFSLLFIAFCGALFAMSFAAVEAGKDAKPSGENAVMKTISPSGNSKVVQTGTFAASTSLQDLERATVKSLKTIKELTVKDGAGATNYYTITGFKKSATGLFLYSARGDRIDITSGQVFLQPAGGARESISASQQFQRRRRRLLDEDGDDDDNDDSASSEEDLELEGDPKEAFIAHVKFPPCAKYADRRRQLQGRNGRALMSAGTNETVEVKTCVEQPNPVLVIELCKAGEGGQQPVCTIELEEEMDRGYLDTFKLFFTSVKDTEKVGEGRAQLPPSAGAGARVEVPLGAPAPGRPWGGRGTGPEGGRRRARGGGWASGRVGVP